MNESEWLSSDDPVKMLRFVHENPDHDNITCCRSDRKLSLWAAACWRMLTPHEPIHEARAVDVETGYRDWQSMVKDLLPSSEYSEAHDIVCRRLYPTWAALLRCVVGNPWRPVTLLVEASFEVLHASVAGGVLSTEAFGRCSWLTPTVIRLAQTIYDERRWDALPILADALEEAGCDNADLTAALRGPGPWCRGAWPLDLLLGKE